MVSPLPSPTVLRESPDSDAATPYLELRSWSDQFGLVAGITTREHGSLGLGSEEPVGEVLGRWRALRATFASRFPALVLSHQMHGTEIGWHQSLLPGWLIVDGLDGHSTADQGVLLAVTVADCIPVYLAAPGRAVALLHAGWRGVAGGILERGVAELLRRGSWTISELVMHCGIGICGACYEVSSEVAEHLTGVTHAGPAHLDLRAILARRAEALGIERVTSSPWCSAHDRDRFFSHRASGGRDGRMVAYLGMPIA